jgi:hypothetical protein
MIRDGRTALESRPHKATLSGKQFSRLRLCRRLGDSRKAHHAYEHVD